VVSTAANALAARTPTVAVIATTQTTNSTTATDLTTIGPVVTVTTGTQALVGIGFFGSNNSAGDAAQMWWAVSGASTIAAGVTGSLFAVTGANLNSALAIIYMQTGLTAGVNVFTAKYSSAGGGTSSFANRQLFVIPL
jgi:hypothetical protein